MDVDGQSEEPPAWELYKENAQPLKRGRDSKKLGLSLSTRATGGADPNLERMAEFEEMTKSEALANCEDPLAVWIRYINFVRDAYPSSDGVSKCVPIMERCTRHLCYDPRYQNDDRFIKVWITYAEQTASPSDIFKFMHKNKIGAKVALFWIAWAFVSEKAGQDNFTDKLFTKGIAELAMPVELLVTRQKQFQRRLARKYLQQQSDEAEESGKASKKQTETTFTDENGETRKVLSSVSRKAALPGAIRQKPGQAARPPKGLPVSSIAAATGGAATANKPNSSFPIFKDDTTPNPYAFLDNTSSDSGARDYLPTQAEKSKENVGMAKAWNDPDVIASLKPGNKSKMEIAPPTRTEVFVEEEFLEKEDATLTAKPSTLSHEPKLTIRQELDRPMSTAEVLASNPLSFFDEKSLPSKTKTKTKKPKESGSTNITTTSAASDKLKYVDPPVGVYNFKCGFKADLVMARSGEAQESEMSFEEIRAEQWLKRKQKMQAQRNEAGSSSETITEQVGAMTQPKLNIFSDEPASKPAASKPAFEIFSDEPASKPAPSKPAFEIFSDEPASKPAASKPAFEIFSDEPASKPAASKPAFEIFSDEPPASKPAASKPAFEIFSDEPASKPAASKPAFEIFSDEPASKPAAVVKSNSFRHSESDATVTINSLEALQALSDIFGDDGAMGASVGGVMNLAPQTPPRQRFPFEMADEEETGYESPARAGGGDEGIYIPNMPCTPPARPQRFAFAVHEDEVAHIDSENLTPEKSQNLPLNPNRRALNEVVREHGEDAILRPLPSLAVREEFGEIHPSNFIEVEEGDEEGEMPAEADIYSHMRGIETSPDRTPGASMNLQSLKSLDFEIYCDEEEDSAGKGDETLEFMEMPPELETQAIVKPGERRGTADPAFLTEMLMAFRDEEN